MTITELVICVTFIGGMMLAGVHLGHWIASADAAKAAQTPRQRTKVTHAARTIAQAWCVSPEAAQSVLDTFTGRTDMSNEEAAHYLLTEILMSDLSYSNAVCWLDAELAALTSPRITQPGA